MNRPLQNIGKKGCIPTSSKCIVWDGPDITCIDVCRGDSVEDIVSKLAQYVCNLNLDCCPVTAADLANIEFTCKIPFSDTVYLIDAHNVYEFLEQICSWIYSIYHEVVNPFPDKTALLLPQGLWYTENGDPVHELGINAYIGYLANKLCEVIATQTELQNQIDDLVDNIEDLQDQIDNLPPAKVPDIYITSGCASSGHPGEEVEISVAFETFETYFCNYISVLGLTTQWTSALGTTCAGLANSPQLSNPTHDMNELSGWISSPSTVAQNYQNLWLTICDMRTAVQNYVNTVTSTPCILAMPEDFTLDTVGVTSATVSWSAPTLAGIQAPIGYLIQVFLASGTTPIGSALFNASYAAGTTSATIASSYITAGQSYIVQLCAIYTCGQSEYTSIIGKLKTNIIIARINVTDESTDDYWGDTIDCTDDDGTTTYDVYHRKTTVSLVDSVGSPITNGSGAPIMVVLRYTVDSCGITGASDDVVFTIPIGSGDATYDYIAQTIVNCGDGCTPIVRVLTCGVYISDVQTEFGTGITQCV